MLLSGSFHVRETTYHSSESLVTHLCIPPDLLLRPVLPTRTTTPGLVGELPEPELNLPDPRGLSMTCSLWIILPPQVRVPPRSSGLLLSRRLSLSLCVEMRNSHERRCRDTFQEEPSATDSSTCHTRSDTSLGSQSFGSRGSSLPFSFPFFTLKIIVLRKALYGVQKQVKRDQK